MSGERAIGFPDGFALVDDPRFGSVNKFGRTPNVDAATPTDVWDGSIAGVGSLIWVPPSAARIHAIGSGNADDTAAGAGAQAVEVQGLDANWAVQTETVELAGVATVNTVGSYLRIFRMKVTRVGANGIASDNITATAAVDGTVTAAIITPNNQTLMAIYTVPTGKTAYMVAYYTTMNRNSPSNSSADVKLFVKSAVDVSTSPWQLKHMKGLFVAGTSSICHRFYPYYVISEKSDIKIQIDNCTDNNTDFAAGFDLILRDN